MILEGRFDSEIDTMARKKRGLPRYEIEVMTRYVHEQGLTARTLTVAGLFAPATFHVAKI